MGAIPKLSFVALRAKSVSPDNTATAFVDSLAFGIAMTESVVNKCKRLQMCFILSFHVI